MITQPNDFLMQAWKQQVDGCLRTIEALVEGATSLHEIQLEAAAHVHTDLEATRKAIADTTDPARVLELQAQWARASAEKCAAYWRRFYEVGAQTQASLAQCMVPAAQQFYKLPAIPDKSAPGGRTRETSSNPRADKVRADVKR